MRVVSLCVGLLLLMGGFSLSGCGCPPVVRSAFCLKSLDGTGKQVSPNKVEVRVGTGSFQVVSLDRNGCWGDTPGTYTLRVTYKGEVKEKNVQAGGSCVTETESVTLHFTQSASTTTTGALRAISVGEFGNIVELSGTSWKQIPALVSTELSDVVMVNKEVAFAVGSGGVILKRTREGWKKFASPTQENLFCIAQHGEDFLLVGSVKGKIWKYDGKEWKEMPNPATRLKDAPMIKKISILSKDFVIAVGGNSNQVKDGVVMFYDGKSWKMERERLDPDLVSVAVASKEHVVIGGHMGDPRQATEMLLLTGKPGSWKKVQTGIVRRHVMAIDFLNADFGIAVTDGGGIPQTALDGSGLIMKYEQGKWSLWMKAVSASVNMAFMDACLWSKDSGLLVGNEHILLMEKGKIKKMSVEGLGVGFVPGEKDPLLRAVTCVR